MLQSIRDRLVGWVAWGVVILISVPFAIVGVADFGGYTPSTVLEVDGVAIEQDEYQRRYQFYSRGLRARVGNNYQAEAFEQEARRQTLDALTDEILIRALTEDNDLRVSDRELRETLYANTDFRRPDSDTFDFDVYRAALAQQGYTPALYEEALREQRLLGMIPRTAGDSGGFVTEREIRRMYALYAHERDIQYILIGADYFPDDIEVAAAEAQAYYDDNPNTFTRPEQIKFEYIRMSAALLAEQVEVTDELLRQYYAENADRYVVEEQRSASHILIALADDKSPQDDPEVQRKLDEIKTKLDASENFAVLAEQYSDDSGSAQAGGDLGQVTRGMMVAPFEDALFAIGEVGEVVGPIRTSFGFHFIRLDGLSARSVKTFEEVRDELAEEYALQQASGAFYDNSERLAELSYENGEASLSLVADALGAPLHSTDWISRQHDSSGVESHPGLLEQAFQRRYWRRSGSAPVEVGHQDVVVFRITDHREALLPPFDEVSEQVEATMKAVAADQRLSEFVEQLARDIQAGEAAEDAAQRNELTVETLGPVAKDDPALPPGIADTVFTVPVPQQGGVSAEVAPLPAGDYAIVVLRGIVMPEEGPDRDEIARQLRQRHATATAQSMLAGIREAADVVIHEDRL